MPLLTSSAVTITAQNNAFKTHNDSIETWLPALRYWMSRFDTLGNTAFESPHTEVCAPKIIISAHEMFTIFVAILIAKQSMNLLPRVFRYALWERPSDFYHTRVAHKSWRDVKFPMLFGMGPVSWLLYRYLHPNIYTGWVGCEFQCSPHEVCIAFCSLVF